MNDPHRTRISISTYADGSVRVEHCKGPEWARGSSEDEAVSRLKEQLRREYPVSVVQKEIEL